MAKTKEYNQQLIKDELDKLPLAAQVTQFLEIEKWLNEKLDDQGKEIVALRTKLENGKG